MGYCHYCKQDKKLIKAHIIPRNFYLDYVNEHFVLVNADTGKITQKQSGSYDKDILCADCDGKILKKFDDEGYRILLGDITKYLINRSGTNSIYYLEKEEFNYEYIRKFFISIIWRASISKLDEYLYIDLGPYEEKALEILKDEKTYSNLFKVLIFKAPSNRDYNKLVYIAKAKWGNCTTYVISMAGYFINVIVNIKKLNPNLCKLYKNLFLNEDKLCIIESEQVYLSQINGITNKMSKMWEKGFRPPKLKY